MVISRQIMSANPKIPSNFIQFLDAELHSIVTESNVDFLMAHSKCIQQVIGRSYFKVRNFTPAQMFRLYGELAFELALCEDQVGSYRDPQIAAICINLRLQRKLDRVLAQKKPRVVANASLESVTTKPRVVANAPLECVTTKPRKPKFKPARCVA